MKKNSIQLPRLAGFAGSTLAVAISATLPVQAQEIKELPTARASAQTESGYRVESAVTPKYTQPLVDTAKTISVIPQSVMKDRNIDSLRDALRNVSGISLAAGEGGAPPGDSMHIRGFSAHNDIMIDGMRDIAGYSRDMFNVEAVEVSKGPSSAVSGRGGAGGSINLLSKTAKLDDFTDTSLRLGSESDYRATVDANKILGAGTALRINVLSDDGEVAGRDEVENSNDAVAVSLVTGLNSGTRFTLNADYQKQDNIPVYGLPWVPNYSGRADRRVADYLANHAGGAPPVDYSNFYGNVNRDFEEIDAKSVTARLEHEFSESTRVRAQVRAGSVERLTVVTAPRFTATDIGGVNVYGEDGVITLGDEKTRDTEDSMAALQVDLIGNYQTGAVRHDIVAGFEVAREEFERWNYVALEPDNLVTQTVDLFNPNSQLAFTGRYGRDGSKQKATGDTTALYVFDTLRFNPQWQMTLGLRWDNFDTEYQYDFADPSLKLKSEDSELSWNFGLVYKPRDNGSIYFGAGNSFSPSAEDLTASSNGNNADLDPEEILSYELGTKWELLDGRLLAGAAIFRTEKNHARTDDPLAIDSSDETLNGEQRVDGLELSAIGQITDQLSITAAYTFQDSEVVKAEGDDAAQEGAELPRTPDHSFSLWGRYDINDRLALGLGAQYMGERYNSSDPGGREQADDFLIFDAMIAYRVTDKWGLQLNGTNLSDEEYEDQLGGGHFVPGLGRYFAITTTYSF